VIDRGIEAELVSDIGTLLRPAGDSDGPGAGQFGKLANNICASLATPR
jgi:hypothetical protein